MKKLTLSLLWLSFLLTLERAWPQAGISTVRGVAHDQSSAVVPSAVVTLTNTDTNVKRSTITNEAGLYVFPGVFPDPTASPCRLPASRALKAPSPSRYSRTRW